MTKHSKIRKIIHMDLDAFFCAVEELEQENLKEKPFAVGGKPDERGVVSSCSYAARRFGVHSAMPMSQALKLCPELIIISPRHALYQKKSEQVMSILQNYSALIEQVSIDEAFLDVSDMSEDGDKIAQTIKNQIRSETNLSASFGIAQNKLLAKLANDVGKKRYREKSYPGSILLVVNGREAEFLAPLSVDMLWGVGKKTKLILMEMGIKTIGDLTKTPLNLLIQKFGKNGSLLSQYANGIDDRPLEVNQDLKSISQEMTFSKDVMDREVIRLELMEMSEMIGHRLRAHKVFASTIRLKIRYADFSTYTRQVHLSQPVDQDTIIFDTGLKLFNEFWDQRSKIRLIGLGATQLVEGIEQLSFWQNEADRERLLLNAVDKLKEKYGKNIVKKATKLDHKKEK
jgi:nucleotidyltransferase/DNA polymerase involved in DNA repair